jgi:hypothetical protein
MSTVRDKFSPGVKQILAHRAGYRCSKPSCRAFTAGPSDEEPTALANVGVASHITAAAAGGPRFDRGIGSEARKSVANGIWLCQTHAKEIDDDVQRFTPEILRAWKEAAEGEARAMLGIPISAQALDAQAEVVLHRAADNSLIVVGSTNLPNGTRIWVDLHRTGSGPEIGHMEARVHEGTLGVSGFKDGEHPFPHGWYCVELLSYFNGPWQQSAAVMEIVGPDAKYLAGKFAEDLHPELPESEKRFRAEFECVAPVLSSVPERSEVDLQRAIQITQQAVLTVDGHQSASPILEVVQWFMTCPDIRPREGWTAKALPNGAVIVSYAHWNGKNNPATSEWIVILDTGEVRYRNLYGKLMSWMPED